jgi:ankyrin repeat protein
VLKTTTTTITKIAASKQTNKRKQASKQTREMFPLKVLSRTTTRHLRFVHGHHEWRGLAAAALGVLSAAASATGALHHHDHPSSLDGDYDADDDSGGYRHSRAETSYSYYYHNSTNNNTNNICHCQGGEVLHQEPPVSSNYTTASPTTIQKKTKPKEEKEEEQQQGTAVTTNNNGGTGSAVSSSSSLFRIQDVYDIEEVLGEGAYGMVYRARRKSDGKAVALKTMPRSLTGKTDFEREVAALQLLSKPQQQQQQQQQPEGGVGGHGHGHQQHGGHAHIVEFYDVHRDDQNYYLAMELIEGGELLEHLIENGPYSEAVAASFLRQFAEAICFVHGNGLAHADLKPENLLLSTSTSGGGGGSGEKAQLKVTDFGCARSHDMSRKDMHVPAQEFAIGCSFLHMVALGNQFELEKLLQENNNPALVNFRDYDFRTPLHLAASEGHVDICRFLIERGARINRTDRWGGSPLDDAHRHRHPEVIQYLHQQGATFGTPSQLPRFIQAASEGDLQEAQALLEFGNIDLDQGDYDKRAGELIF